MLPERPVRSSTVIGTATSRGYLLQRVRLRLLVLSITVTIMLLFITVALLNRRAASVALAGAILVAVNGVVWLLVLRRGRARLRRHRYRW